jgi:hypothetical protein
LRKIRERQNRKKQESEKMRGQAKIMIEEERKRVGERRERVRE